MDKNIETKTSDKIKSSIRYESTDTNGVRTTITEREIYNGYLITIDTYTPKKDASYEECYKCIEVYFKEPKLGSKKEVEQESIMNKLKSFGYE